MKLQQAVAAIALREAGLPYKEISARLGGIPESTLAGWFRKGAPDVPTACAGCGGPVPERRGASRFPKWCSGKCRKRTLYSGVCIDCGEQTGGTASGLARSAKRCSPCALRFQSENARWTRDTVVAAIREWVDVHGMPPSADDWRFQQGRNIPPSSTVQRVFGKWSDAIVAAGFARPAPGRRRRLAA